ncbi:zinc finger protein 398-like [Ambystoma mexicanum]|uniref:zinc finger protein 398-like n=1 Tax=Ambystoma mexicanum TaxID=8296 RepID=UPI0037E7B815
MSRQRLHKAQVTFQDVVASFSEVEWKLLQEWQEELVKNVMNEIQHSLLLLGPAIATCVFSLRANDNHPLCAEDEHGPEERCNVNRSPRFPDPHLKSFIGAEEESIGDLMDHLGADVGEKSTSTPRSVVSIRIKQEEDTYAIGHQYSEIKEGIGRPTSDPSFASLSQKLEKQGKKQKEPKPEGHTTGEGNRKRKIKAVFPEACTGKTTQDMHQTSKSEVHWNTENGTNSRTQLWSESDAEAENDIQYESGVMNTEEHSELYEGISNTGTYDTYSDFNSNLWEANLLMRLQDKQKHLRPFSCPDCGKSFKMKQHLTRHQRTHSGERPYHCTACQRRFSMKHHLTRHQRTHTGGRLYQYNQLRNNVS